MKLHKTRLAFGKPDFENIAKSEIQDIDTSLLPLQQGLSLSSYVSDADINVIILSSSESDTEIKLKTGVFYCGIIAGCSCADDPTPMDEQNEYCELQFSINKNTADTTVQLIS